jgi:hypothetical protein
MNVLVPYMLNENQWVSHATVVRPALTIQNWGLKTAFFYTGLGAPFAIGAWFIIPEPAG